MKTGYIFQLLILAGLLDLSIQWTGRVCSRTICRYRRVRRCAYRTWMGCCYYRWYWVPDYQTVYFCCPGWTTSSSQSQNCNQAICNPPCQNGGTCVRPNVCRCNDGAIGSRCNTLVCNYQRPCFPGMCTPGTSVNCDCSSGFTSPSTQPRDYCRQLESTQKPEIYEIGARLSFWQRGTGMPTMEKYSLYADSTMSNTADSLWTNRERFNWVNVTASANYMTDNHTQPFFIKRYGIGIARAEVDIKHQKLPLKGSNPVVSLDMTLPCTPTVSYLKPTADTYYCDITKPDYDRSLENGDTLTLTFKTWNGGYRELQELTSSGLIDRGSQTYNGHMVYQSMQFRFDFKKPNHSCLSQGSSCSDEPFSMTQDVTKDPISLRWSNWDDILSGMYRYAWEVFKLQVDGNQVLKEDEPLKPIYGPIEVNQSSSASNSFQATYTPTDPGVYSFILEASDKANNSVFVRRIAIYDPVSSVTLDTGADNRLYISSADPNGGYNWQDDPSRDIKVTWTNHFANLMHEQGKWLNQVLAYPPELEDFLKNIPRESKQDDHEGQRTVDAIPNRRGVVKFEIAYAKDSNAGVNQTEPTTGWTDVGLNERYTIPPGSRLGTLTNKDTVTVWVRATDVLGNNRVDSTKVHFDNTPPEVEEPVFKRNVQTNGVPFSSTVEVNVRDMQSGMKRVELIVKKISSNLVIVNETLPLRTIASCNSFTTCYCTTVNPVCFNKTQILPISNCWLKHPMLEGKTVTMDMNFVNMAGLHTTKSFTVNQLNTLNGTLDSLAPVNVTIAKKETNLVTLVWKHALSCYNRTEMWINYEVNGRTEMTLLHKTATTHTLVGLQPDTAYKIVVISQYGEFKSMAVPVTVTTESDGLSGGAVAGIVIGVLLLLIVILVIVGLVLFKLGLIAGILGRDKKYRERPHVESTTGTTAAKQRNRTSRWAYDNTTYTKDDDIYIYGSMDLGEPWYVPPEDISLTEVIATGKFAKIYKAKWMESPKNVREVAAKVLKVRESEDDILFMLAKINFAATQVGDHRNVLGFLGAVMENDALGPVMVLEYCETGQLDKWLTNQRSKINEETLDRIQNFALEIARAMEYLTSKGIVHRKLAARNCLLTFLLDIKVSGFGPSKVDESSQDNKGDRIPIKWTAPECLRSLKDANEKSDAWSYGVTIWEVFSMGGDPYENIRGRDIPTKVKSGYRMSRPEYAEDIHFKLMQDCWSESPAKRPTFKKVVNKLETTFGLRRDGDDGNYYYQR
uniref:Fibroblast growth factor receptor n=1 Tax=Haliotis diversicolor TaxID=36095 RepID=A0A2L0NG74_HALDV|nr:fibroblast growth factor receptor [Haliotis diversicolor]